MPIFPSSRNTVRQAVGRSSNLMLGGRTFAVTSGSLADSVIAQDLVLTDTDQARGLHLYIPDGGGSGQARTVISATAFVQGTGSILYPHLNFAPTASTNSNLELWQRVAPTVVNGFIDDAIRNAAQRVLDHKEYTFSMVADTFAYDLPVSSSSVTGFAYISEVIAESAVGSGEYNTRIPNDQWHIDADTATRRIIFTKGLFEQYLIATRKVKLIGQRFARLPTADTDNLEVDPEYVRLHVMYSLMDSMPWDDIDRSKRDRWARDAEAKLMDITTAVYPDSAIVESW